MRSLIWEGGLLLLNLPHQAVELLVHLVFPLAVFESLDVFVDTGAQPVLFGLIALLALTLCLHLPVQELLGLQFLLLLSSIFTISP